MVESQNVLSHGVALSSLQLIHSNITLITLNILSGEFLVPTGNSTASQNHFTYLFLGATTQLILSSLDPIKYESLIPMHIKATTKFW